ncbi:MAG TPA: thioredoxin [Terriglobales bacterium]|nr:thioredoxin [Terriglobales bacterium]
MTDGNVQLISCPSCATANRVPRAKLAQGLRPICGRCKAALPATEHPVIVTDANYGTTVESSPQPVLLDLWAPWCGPCRTLAPIIEQLAGELSGRVRVAKLNVDENPATAARFAVQGIPTLLILRQGREVGRIVGAVPKAEILRQLGSFL